MLLLLLLFVVIMLLLLLQGLLCCLKLPAQVSHQPLLAVGIRLQLLQLLVCVLLRLGCSCLGILDCLLQLAALSPPCLCLCCMQLLLMVLLVLLLLVCCNLLP